jgi:hypothetical protein
MEILKKKIRDSLKNRDSPGKNELMASLPNP